MSVIVHVRRPALGGAPGSRVIVPTVFADSPLVGDVVRHAFQTWVVLSRAHEPTESGEMQLVCDLGERS